MLTPEQIARLSPEQLAIAERWERERDELEHLVKQLQTAMQNKDEVLWKSLQDNVDKKRPTHCEHERSIWSTCCACNEIEHLLNPEWYDENGDRLSDEEIEKILNEATK